MGIETMARMKVLVMLGFGLACCTAAVAQDMDPETLRTKIREQIKALDAGAQPAVNGRSLFLNNAQDIQQPLYPSPPAQQVVPPKPAPQPGQTSAQPPAATGSASAIDLEVPFEHGSDVIERRYLPALAGYAEILASPEFAGRVIAIIGHTNSIGDATYNQRLSERRAASVVKELVQVGVPGNRLFSQGAGETMLKPDIPSVSEKNRRVEVRVLR